MSAWQFSKAHYLAVMRGQTPFVSMQDHYNLLYREEEREMLPLCADQGVGVIPWSPLARGRLARAWDEVRITSCATATTEAHPVHASALPASEPGRGISPTDGGRAKNRLIPARTKAALQAKREWRYIPYASSDAITGKCSISCSVSSAGGRGAASSLLND